MYLAFKVIVTALIIAAISELSRRYSILAAVLASLPLTSILAFIWIYYETGDTQKIASMSQSIFWLVLPSLAFFLMLSFLIKIEWRFLPAMLTASAVTAILYGIAFLLFAK